MKLSKIPVSQIKPSAYNPRRDLKPGDPAYQKLKRSMEEFGYIQPIIWNKKTGNIIGGHQRFKILLDKGESEIECIVLELDDAREKALNLALNKIEGDWDEEKLSELLQELSATDEIDSLLTGFDFDDLIPDGPIGEPETRILHPYDKQHILISCTIAKAPDVMEIVNRLQGMEGVEIENAAN